MTDWYEIRMSAPRTADIDSLADIGGWWDGVDAATMVRDIRDLDVDEIRLNIPERYRRFPEWDGTLPEVPEGVTIARCAQDYGPATKLLPTLQAYAGQPVDILLCDDDRIHDRNWTARFSRPRPRLRAGPAPTRSAAPASCSSSSAW